MEENDKKTTAQEKKSGTAKDSGQVSSVVPPDRQQQMVTNNSRRMSSAVVPNQPLQVASNKTRPSVVQQPSMADNRRVSTVVPPDRQQQMMTDNPRRMSSAVAPNQPLQLVPNSKRLSVVQQPSVAQVSFPEKFRRTSMARGPLLDQLQKLDSIQLTIDPTGTGKQRRSAPEEMARRQSVAAPLGGVLALQQQQQQKLSKAEVEEYYSRIKTISKFRKSQSFGSLTSTLGSVSSCFSVSSSVAGSEAMYATGGGHEWSQRWLIDKTGRKSGQIRWIKDVCFFHNGEYIAVTECKNSRIQVFSTTGKSLGILGAESENDRTAASFANPGSARKMEPTGICESRIYSILAVTDHNRLLYVDASATGQLVKEVIIPNRYGLHGIAAARDDKFIITEIGSHQSSVGLFESNGRIIREYKGDFKRPAYVAWNEEFEVAAVSDSEQRTVYLYDSNGHLLNKLNKQLGSKTAGGGAGGDEDDVGALVYPSGVSWFSDGRLLVVDRSENRVVLVDLRNMQAEEVLTEQQHGLGNPVAMATNQKNRIVLSEEFYDFGVDNYHLKMFKHRSPNFGGDF